MTDGTVHIGHPPDMAGIIPTGDTTTHGGALHTIMVHITDGMTLGITDADGTIRGIITTDGMILGGAQVIIQVIIRATIQVITRDFILYHHIMEAAGIYTMADVKVAVTKSAAAEAAEVI